MDCSSCIGNCVEQPDRLSVDVGSLAPCGGGSAIGSKLITLWRLSGCPNATWNSLPNAANLGSFPANIAIQHKASTNCWILAVTSRTDEVTVWYGCKQGSSPAGLYEARSQSGWCADGTNAKVSSLTVYEGAPPVEHNFKGNFRKTKECATKLFCRPCRLDPFFRQAVNGGDFDCPAKITQLDFDPKHYPPLLEQAANLLKAAGRLVVRRFIEQRAIGVDDATFKQRYNICGGTKDTPKCEFFDVNPNRCRKCGCVRGFKILLLTERCPIDKW